MNSPLSKSQQKRFGGKAFLTFLIPFGKASFCGFRKHQIAFTLGDTKIMEICMKNDFLWLQQWFQAHCNGKWEQVRRIYLETLDNPGWWLTINLENTALKSKNFEKIKIDRSEEDWIFCEVKNTKFDSGGGVENLPEVLKVFHHWAENEPFDLTLENTKIVEKSIEEDDFLWLQQWYQDYCNGDWEHTYGVCLKSLDNPGWALIVDLNETNLEDIVI